MISDAEVTGKSKTAAAVETDIAFKQNCAIAKNRRILKGIIQQLLSITLAL